MRTNQFQLFESGVRRVVVLWKDSVEKVQELRCVLVRQCQRMPCHVVVLLKYETNTCTRTLA